MPAKKTKSSLKWGLLQRQKTPPLHCRLMVPVNINHLDQLTHGHGIDILLRIAECFATPPPATPEQLQAFPVSRLSTADITKMYTDRIIEPCPHPQGGGKCTTLVEKIGLPKERRRILHDLLYTNVFTKQATKVSFQSLECLRKLAASASHASSYDFEKWFYQLEIPRTIRDFMAFKTQDGRWHRVCVASMGHINSVALAQIVSSTLANIAAAESGSYVSLDVYIDNILVLGSEDALHSFHQKFCALCYSVNATLGEMEIGKTKISHRGMIFNLTAKVASLKLEWVEKFISRFNFIMGLRSIPIRYFEAFLGMAVYRQHALPSAGAVPLWHCIRRLAAAKADHADRSCRSCRYNHIDRVAT